MPASGSQQGASSNRKRKSPQSVALAACTACRQSKLRCDGARPACARCAKRDTAVCTYETEADETRWQAQRRRHDQLQTSHQATNDSLSWLASQSPDTVAACLKQIAGTENAVDELCTLVAERRSHHVTKQVSAGPSILTASPWLHRPADVELSVEHVKSYPWLAIDDCVNLVAFNETGKSAQTVHSNTTAAIRPLNSSSFELPIDFWTTGSIPNDLSGALLDLYLRVEHPLYGFFDATLFVRDLLACRTQYCSSLLVSSILLWTCSTFAPLLPQALAYEEPLLASVNLLLVAELNAPSLLTTASLMILSLRSICAGDEEAAQRHMIAGVRMAEAMHLTGVARHGVGDFTGTSDDRSMLSYVAWGAFNLSTIITLHFHDLESGTFTRSPPILPLPVPAPIPNVFRPASSLLVDNSSFPYFCQFWCIAHEIAAVYFAKPEPPQNHVPLAYTESRYRRLLEWADALPSNMVRSESMSHDVAEMHICYHATIMDLFRPFLAEVATAARYQPPSIFVLSFNHLRALTNYYYLAFSKTEYSHTIAWIHGPLYIASAIISYEHQKSQQSSFLLVMRAFPNFVASHAVVAAFVKGLYGMAVAAKVLTAAEAKKNWTTMYEPRIRARDVERMRTSVVIDQDLAMNDLAAAVGEKLAQAFDEMMLFQDYTSLDDQEKTPKGDDAR